MSNDLDKSKNRTNAEIVAEERLAQARKDCLERAEEIFKRTLEMARKEFRKEIESQPTNIQEHKPIGREMRTDSHKEPILQHASEPKQSDKQNK